MKRLGKKRLRLVLALVLGPPVLWVLILALLPMEWARVKVVASLRSSTAQEVRLGAVRLRPFGGLSLSGLEVADTKTGSDPWLKVRDLTVDISVRDLIVGSISPTECVASGVALRVRRDESGRLEFEDLLKPDPKAASANSVAPAAAKTVRQTRFRLDDASITVDDDPTDTLLEFTEVQGRGTYNGTTADLTELTATLNGGSIAVAARYDWGDGTSIVGDAHIHHVALGVGMKALGYVIPLVATNGDGSQAQGTLSLELDMKAKGDTSESLAKTLSGRGQVALDDLTLDNSAVMAEVAKVLPVPTRGQLGSLRGDFDIADRRVTTANTVLEVARVPVNLVGWSDFDGRLDYRVKSEKIAKKVTDLAGKLPSEAREILADLPVDDLGGLTDVQISGTMDHMIVRSAEGNTVLRRNANRDPARRAEDRAKLKAVGKRLLDRVVR